MVDVESNGKVLNMVTANGKLGQAEWAFRHVVHVGCGRPLRVNQGARNDVCEERGCKLLSG
jgi:hypothetical protein